MSAAVLPGEARRTSPEKLKTALRQPVRWPRRLDSRGGPSPRGDRVPEADPYHQFQMLLKPLQRALKQGNVEAALRLAGHLLGIGGSPREMEDRKVHFLLRAMEGATPDVKTEFTARVVERFGKDLGEDSRARLSGLIDRL